MGSKFRDRRSARLFIVSEDHLAHRLDAPFLEEHVLGAAEADALSAKTHCGFRIRRRVGIGTHAQLAHLVSPADQRGKFPGQLRLDHVDLARQHLPSGAVDRDVVALLEGLPAGRHRARGIVDAQRTSAGNAGLTHAARDNSGVGSHAATGGQDSFRRVHAVDVLRRGFHPHQDNFSRVGFELRGFIGRENDFATRRTGRRRQARGDNPSMRARVDGRVQQLIEGERINAQHRIALGDQPFIGKLDRDAQCSLRSTFSRTRLQHPELALLDGELEVLHVAVVALESVVDALELGVGLGQRVFHRRLVGARLLACLLADFLRRANAGDDVLALRVDEKFAVELLFARRRVAREGDAGRRGVAHVAENHGLHVDGRAPAFRKIVKLAVGDGALVHP